MDRGDELPETLTSRIGEDLRSLILLAVNEENEDRVREKTLDLCKNGSIEFLSILGPSDLSESLMIITFHLCQVLLPQPAQLNSTFLM